MLKCAGNVHTLVMKVMGFVMPVFFIFAAIFMLAAANVDDNNVLDKSQFEAAFQGKQLLY